MDRINQPSKEHVREWLRERQAGRVPPPDPAQIRRELGWKLMESASDASEAPHEKIATV